MAGPDDEISHTVPPPHHGHFVFIYFAVLFYDC